MSTCHHEAVPASLCPSIRQASDLAATFSDNNARVVGTNRRGYQTPTWAYSYRLERSAELLRPLNK